MKFDPKQKKMLLISHLFNNWKRSGMPLETQGLEIARLLKGTGRVPVEWNNMYNEVCDACCCDMPFSLAQKRYESLRANAHRLIKANPEEATIAEQTWKPLGSQVNVLLSVLYPERFGYEIEHAVGRPMWGCAEPNTIVGEQPIKRPLKP